MYLPQYIELVRLGGLAEQLNDKLAYINKHIVSLDEKFVLCEVQTIMGMTEEIDREARRVYDTIARYIKQQSGLTVEFGTFTYGAKAENNYL